MSLEESQQGQHAGNHPIIPVPQASREPAGEASNVQEPTE